MENIFGKDYNSMKAIISAPDITNRKLYRASHQRRRRIANFCGSVNESRFLRDSNNRRYLCFAITDIKADYINIDIDAVWAEVKHKADKAKVNYIFGKEDYRLIDLMNASFEAPTEEAEALSTILKPSDGKGTTYYMQFTEILQVLRDYTHNNQLKPYNLQTAMRKYGFQTKSVKQSRFDMQPRNMYPVAIIPNDKWLYDRCYKFMDYKLTEEEL
jgi:predicted P-loop ATPase